jgi:hypothetical protein
MPKRQTRLTDLGFVASRPQREESPEVGGDAEGADEHGCDGVGADGFAVDGEGDVILKVLGDCNDTVEDNAGFGIDEMAGPPRKRLRPATEEVVGHTEGESEAMVAYDGNQKTRFDALRNFGMESRFKETDQPVSVTRKGYEALRQESLDRGSWVGVNYSQPCWWEQLLDDKPTMTDIMRAQWYEQLFRSSDIEEEYNYYRCYHTDEFVGTHDGTRSWATPLEQWQGPELSEGDWTEIHRGLQAIITAEDLTVRGEEDELDRVTRRLCQQGFDECRAGPIEHGWILRRIGKSHHRVMEGVSLAISADAYIPKQVRELSKGTIDAALIFRRRVDGMVPRDDEYAVPPPNVRYTVPGSLNQLWLRPACELRDRRQWALELPSWRIDLKRWSVDSFWNLWGKIVTRTKSRDRRVSVGHGVDAQTSTSRLVASNTNR